MSEDDIPDSDIVGVRKWKGARGSSSEEVIVIFRDVDTHDLACSHARNLGEQIVAPGEKKSNIRLDIPAHLLETFRTLDKHGHLLKQKYGQHLRRHVRFDDENLSLYLDVRKNSSSPWERIMPEQARHERAIREKKDSS